MKIGVLYPRSKAHPNLLIDFSDGIKLALKHSGVSNQIELITESIGYGGNEKEVFEKAEKVLILEAADLLIAYIDVRVVSILEPLLDTCKKLMIVVNPGANSPGNQPTHPYIIYLTLQHGFLCWLTGLQGSNYYNNKGGAVMATSFYDAGYLHIADITTGYINSGGNIRYNYINSNQYNETFEIKQLTGYLSTEKEIQNLLCVFDREPASLFLNLLNQYEGSNRLQLLVSPMMLDSKAWEETDNGFNFAIEGYLPYHTASENTTNVEFRNFFTAHTKREISVFALLGWEVAIIITEVFKNCKHNYANGAIIIPFLKTIIIDSPRGSLKLDDKTHAFTAPVFKGAVQNNSKIFVITPVNNVDEIWNNFINKPVEGPSSGWSNTYLCY